MHNSAETIDTVRRVRLIATIRVDRYERPHNHRRATSDAQGTDPQFSNGAFFHALAQMLVQQEGVGVEGLGTHWTRILFHET